MLSPVMPYRTSPLKLYHMLRGLPSMGWRRCPRSSISIIRRIGMPRRGQPTTLQERVAIRERAAAGESDPQIAAALGRSVATVRKWRRIAQRHTRPDLASHMGRRPTGPLGTFPPALVEAIRTLRTA